MGYFFCIADIFKTKVDMINNELDKWNVPFQLYLQK